MYHLDSPRDSVRLNAFKDEPISARLGAASPRNPELPRTVGAAGRGDCGIARTGAAVGIEAARAEADVRAKNLFEASRVEEVKERMAQLRPNSERLWGKMNPAQALAHCCAAMGMAMGEICPPRILIGRLLGPWAKKSLIVNGTPMRRNSMTEKSVVVTDERDSVVESQRLRESIDRFAVGGPGICTKHPHFFFGPLTPVEWAALMYQHLDHHLRQFGV
jgi:hypothetical protein